MRRAARKGGYDGGAHDVWAVFLVGETPCAVGSGVRCKGVERSGSKAGMIAIAIAIDGGPSL